MNKVIYVLLLIGGLAACRQAPPLHKQFAAYEEQERLLEQEYNGMCVGYDTIADMQRKAERSAVLSQKFGRWRSSGWRASVSLPGRRWRCKLFIGTCFFTSMTISLSPVSLRRWGRIFPKAG